MCCLMIVYIDSMFKIHNLRHPYETNCTDHVIAHLPGYTKYTTSTCMLSCHSKYLVEKCGCRDVKILGKYRLVELEQRHRQNNNNKKKTSPFEQPDPEVFLRERCFQPKYRKSDDSETAKETLDH